MKLMQITIFIINGVEWRIEGFGITHYRATDLALKAKKLKHEPAKLEAFMRSHGFIRQVGKAA